MITLLRQRLAHHFYFARSCSNCTISLSPDPHESIFLVQLLLAQVIRVLLELLPLNVDLVPDFISILLRLDQLMF